MIEIRAAVHRPCRTSARRWVRNQFLDLVGACCRGDDGARAAVLNDIANLVPGKIAADGCVAEPAALHRPADLHELQPVLHQDSDVAAGVDAERPEQVRSLVRSFVKLAIADRLAAARHLIGDLVRRDPGVH